MSPLNLVDSVIREQGSLSLNERRGALVVVDEMQSMPGVDYESMLPLRCPEHPTD